MSVTHVIARHWFLATNFTDPCHRNCSISKVQNYCLNIPRKKKRGKVILSAVHGTSDGPVRLRKPVFLVNMNLLGLDTRIVSSGLWLERDGVDSTMNNGESPTSGRGRCALGAEHRKLT